MVLDLCVCLVARHRRIHRSNSVTAAVQVSYLKYITQLLWFIIKKFGVLLAKVYMPNVKTVPYYSHIVHCCCTAFCLCQKRSLLDPVFKAPPLL